MSVSLSGALGRRGARDARARQPISAPRKVAQQRAPEARTSTPTPQLLFKRHRGRGLRGLWGHLSFSHLLLEPTIQTGG